MRRRVFMGLLAGGAALAVAPLGGATPHPDPVDLAKAWRSYLSRDADSEPAYHFPYEHCFRRAATAHGLPLTLLLAVARGESDFDPLARSAANAHGLMQILWPETARELGIRRLADLQDPCVNVDAGARYLKQLLARYRGDLHRALAAYNYGPGRVPADGGRVPAGARWYSGYIYSHLLYVVGKGRPPGELPDYAAERKRLLITFNRPYRAQAFVATLHAKAPQARLDWFRAPAGRFRVVLTYRGQAELARSRGALTRAGFSLD